MNMESSQHKLRVHGVIPARMESQRLPGKAMLPICGRPMIHWVYERASACQLLSDLCVATDSAVIKQYCLQNDIPVFLTASTHRSGTERIVELMYKIPADVFVNIQGDEPMIQSEHLVSLIEPFRTRADIEVSTLKTPLEEKDAANPNVVKVVTNRRGQALYFSRATLPYRRNSTVFNQYYKHLGLYAYSRDALERYEALAPGPLEQIEQLEQLRFLEYGIPIYVAETPYDTIGVDTEEDLLTVTKYFEHLQSGV